jgi:hypothetical protein
MSGYPACFFSFKKRRREISIKKNAIPILMGTTRSCIGTTVSSILSRADTRETSANALMSEMLAVLSAASPRPPPLLRH